MEVFAGWDALGLLIWLARDHCLAMTIFLVKDFWTASAILLNHDPFRTWGPQFIRMSNDLFVSGHIEERSHEMSPYLPGPPHQVCRISHWPSFLWL